MTELVVTRGVPGSGKTTWARAWVAADETRRARVNRDDLRENLYGRGAPLPPELEDTVTVAQQAAVRALLAAGQSVVVDDCHVSARYVRAWRSAAAAAGATVVVNDSFALVPVEECIRRDEARGKAGGRHVGPTVIRSMMDALLSSLASHALEEQDALERADDYVYEPDKSLPWAWIVDLDGTLALMNGRGPYDWHRVGEDKPNAPVILVTNALADACRLGDRVIVLSGRNGSCRAATEAWLQEWDVQYDELHMRAEDDRRRDAVVKLEIFRREVAPRFHVRAVLDDRNQVVEMWRRIGLPCFQVAPGAF